MIISTTTGSTGHNLSYGGSIIHPDFQTLQITPIGGVPSAIFRSLSNPIVVPENKNIVIEPEDEDLMISIDGDHNYYDGVKKITTSVKDKRIKCLRFSHYNFSQKINEKLISGEE